MSKADTQHPVLSEYLTVSEAATFLGVSASTLRNWDKTGKLMAKRHPINGYRLYEKSELARLLTDLRGETEPA